MKKGKLIFIEGTDGAGKTTATNIILESLRDKGVDVHQINILSGCKESAQIRAVLTNPQMNLDPTAEVLLYIAAVKNTLVNHVYPMLEQGKTILCDRGPMSSYVYQCLWQKRHGNDVPAKLHRTVFGDHDFDATILVTCDPSVGLERCRSRSGELDRLEMRGIEYFQNIVQDYKDEASRLSENGKNVIVIENNTTLAALVRNCTNAVESIS